MTEMKVNETNEILNRRFVSHQWVWEPCIYIINVYPYNRII